MRGDYLSANGTRKRLSAAVERAKEDARATGRRVPIAEYKRKAEVSPGAGVKAEPRPKPARAKVLDKDKREATWDAAWTLK